MQNHEGEVQWGLGLLLGIEQNFFESSAIWVQGLQP